MPPDETPAVVVPTGSDPAGYASVRSLSRRGVHTVVASDDPDDPAAVSRWCDESVTVPPPATDLLGYRDALRDLAAREDVVTVLPVRQQDPYVLTRYREDFEPHVSLPVPDAETLRTVHDRLDLAAAAEAAGVPTAETRPLSEYTEPDADVIVKSRYNVLADAYCPDCLPGECAVVKDVYHLRPGDAVDAAAAREAMGWHGLACIEYLRDAETGEFVFAEVNPRLWQSLPAAVRVGADFPHYYFLQATGRADAVDCDYELGAGSHLAAGEVSYLLSVLRESSPHVERPSLAETCWDITASVYETPYFDYLRADDPRPFLRSVLNAVK